ncbi:MAG: Asp-tRNA(Asn)/Glu-tRNA(Gln) amidotransferase subunit GatC [Planctomycetes bacterium]|nr:Asp-tRNA(Asn)/Glu-tRNA(Gln) amidotransferase subunit GatC [Planctomycetota bacterium]
MGISALDIQRVATLAKLRVNQGEISELSTQLSKVLDLVNQLSEVDTEGVEPMVHAFELTNVLARDHESTSLPRAEVLKNAPSHDEECFRVPPVLG